VQLTAGVDRKVELRPPPGTKRVRSNVTTKFAPSRVKDADEAKDTDEAKESDSGSDSELEIGD
jgi:hypothetical protein